jgi:hypothetical protein
MRQCRSDGTAAGEVLYCPIIRLGVVVLNGMTMKPGGGAKKLCDNCPKVTFEAQRQSPSACLGQRQTLCYSCHGKLNKSR